MDEIEQELEERAYLFFKNQYRDRGMMKWQGYYLSDHTEDVSKYTKRRDAIRDQKEMPEMLLEEVSNVLFIAYAKNQAVQFQLKTHSNVGMVSPILVGKVKGYVENEAFIGQARVAIEDIRWCRAVNHD